MSEPVPPPERWEATQRRLPLNSPRVATERAGVVTNVGYFTALGESPVSLKQVQKKKITLENLETLAFFEFSIGHV